MEIGVSVQCTGSVLSDCQRMVESSNLVSTSPSPLLGHIQVQERRIQELIHRLSGPLTLLMNASQVRNLPRRRHNPARLLRQVQEASQEIQEGLQALETVLSPARPIRPWTEDPLAPLPKVLWIEEEGLPEPLAQAAVSEMELDFVIHHVGDMPQAVERLRSHPYDLLLTGYRVKGGCGLDLLRIMEGIGVWVPCVMLVAEGSERLAAECLEAGCLGYVNGDMLTEPGRLRRTMRRAVEEGVRLKGWESSMREARTLAITDGLTTLYNRFFIEQLLEMEVCRSRRYGQPFCVALMDLDGFKEINDRFGHFRGDAVLRDLSRLLKGLLRSSDHIGRFGGDEFLLVLPQVSLAGAVKLCGRMIEEVSRHGGLGGLTQRRLTLSVGLAFWSGGDGVEFPQLIQGADLALYEAKQMGKNCISYREVLPKDSSPGQSEDRRQTDPSLSDQDRLSSISLAQRTPCVTGGTRQPCPSPQHP